MSTKLPSGFVLVAALFAANFLSSSVLAVHSLSANAVGIALAHDDADHGSTSLTPGPGSLAVTFAAAASDAVINNSPPPDRWEMQATTAGSGTARYGSLTGQANSEASIRPAYSNSVAEARTNLNVGFIDNALVVSNTLPAGTPATLTFVMTLDATAFELVDGTAPPFDVGAAARIEAEVLDLDDLQRPPITRSLVINSNGTNETFSIFDFDTVVGHRLELDVKLLLGAGVLFPFGVNRQYTQGMAQVVADQTGEFFYQPSGDVRLVSESGHDYAVPELLPGDYNDDGKVDAADYVVWRKTGGPPSDYTTWRTNFGQPGGGGSVWNANVPEPAGALLFMLGAAIGSGRTLPKRRAHQTSDAFDTPTIPAFVGMLDLPD
jgi:hypothetical protein